MDNGRDHQREVGQNTEKYSIYEVLFSIGSIERKLCVTPRRLLAPVVILYWCICDGYV